MPFFSKKKKKSPRSGKHSSKQTLCDGGSQGGLAMINMANGTNVDMGLLSHKLGHTTDCKQCTECG